MIALILNSPSPSRYTGIALVEGNDSSGLFVQSLIYDLVTYPDVQKRAQDEIDSVLGAEGGIPTLDDLERLPYIRGLILEVKVLSESRSSGTITQILSETASPFQTGIPERFPTLCNGQCGRAYERRERLCYSQRFPDLNEHMCVLRVL